jgi:hypothetical protein
MALTMKRKFDRDRFEVEYHRIGSYTMEEDNILQIRMLGYIDEADRRAGNPPVRGAKTTVSVLLESTPPDGELAVSIEDRFDPASTLLERVYEILKTTAEWKDSIDC